MICEYCKREFKSGNKRFCSHLCWVKTQEMFPRKELVCPMCKETFMGKSFRKFCSSRCSHDWSKENGTRRGANNGSWKGGRMLDASGYVLLKFPEHPDSNNLGYVREHRLVMEQSIGRYLTKEEVVHHLNEIKDDNRIENLELMTRTQHIDHHHEERAKRAKFYYFDKARQKWSAYTGSYKNRKQIGRFDTEEEAKEAVRKHRILSAKGPPGLYQQYRSEIRH